ncbi:DUF6183 family protein [Streptomyces sp. NPDC026673]|uniref:DUF6183 family protein n=1 Tax=Streptomyces sp. NPDC026673 TaxID=3155724 RepID=UPI0034019F0A
MTSVTDVWKMADRSLGRGDAAFVADLAIALAGVYASDAGRIWQSRSLQNADGWRCWPRRTPTERGPDRRLGSSPDHFADLPRGCPEDGMKAGQLRVGVIARATETEQPAWHGGGRLVRR